MLKGTQQHQPHSEFVGNADLGSIQTSKGSVKVDF